MLAGSVGVLGIALAACGGGTSAGGPGHAKHPTTTTTTTTLTPAQVAQLQPLLLSVGQFPKGWRQDTSSNATQVQGTPPCIADLALVKGSVAHLSAAFLAKGDEPAAVQSVGTFAPGKAQPSATSLQANLEQCDKATLTQGGTKATISIAALHGLDTGDAGFAAQVTFTSGSQHAYLDVYYAVRGDDSTFLGWDDATSSTSQFRTMAGKALAKL